MHFLIICIALFLFLTSFLMLFYFCFFLNLLSFFDVFHPVVFRAQPKYLIHLYIAFSFVTEEILYSRVYTAPTSPLTISISSVLFLWAIYEMNDIYSSIIFSCAMILSQSLYLTVHFLLIFSTAKYNIFLRLSSVGNDDFVLVIFLNCLFNPSIIFVV